MFAAKSLNDLIEIEVACLLRGEPCDPAEATVRILRSCDDGFDVNDSLITYCAYQHVRDRVGKAAAKAAKQSQDEEVSKQAEMYPLLHTAYAVERDGRTIVVPRGQLSYGERYSKSQELRAEGWAKIQHAEQLDRETEAMVANGELLPDVAA